MNTTIFTTDTQNTEGKNTLVLFLEEEITIHKDLESLRKAMAEGIAQYDQVKIQSGHKVTGDIAFVQMLIAGITQAKRYNSTITLDLQFAEEYRALLEKSGLWEWLES